jgi:dipeptidyl aminopeptidase/acylaminoacyl peptidase
MTARVTAAYGAWPSPISAADVAHAQLRLSFPTIHGDDVWWQETRPDEGGRTTIMHRRPDGEVEELLPAPWNARNRVHEYGGRSYLPIPADGGYGVVFANYEDQRLHRFDPSDSKPRPLTPEAAVPAGLRYADFVLSPDGTEVWCVCEGHVLAPPPANGAAPAGSGGGTGAAGGAGASTGPGASSVSSAPGGAGGGAGTGARDIRRAIVAVPLDGSAADNPAAIRELISGANFYASPTPSPDGGHIAWVQWNHPRMPWDGTEVRVANLENGKVERARTVKGGLNESALAPAWRDERSLYVVSDWSGWWNIYQVGLYGGSPAAQYPAEEEFAGPLWQLGGKPYVVLADNRLAVLHGQGDQRLGIYDPETAELTDLDLPYTDWQLALSVDGQAIVGIAGGPTTPAAVVRLDTIAAPAGGGVEARCTELRRELDKLPDTAYLPIPQAETLEGPFGRPVYAYVFPPTNPAAQAPEGQLPPYVVFVHGGPTGRVSSVLKLERAYFTSRGIGVVDVNYGGSTGYGRSYRERLRKQWGLVDVEDAVAAAQALAAAGEADPDRLAIRGGSAGGWTTLAAITMTSVFKAATSYYGISDLKSFTDETHDFESRYLFGLIGPLPGFERAYEERSPLRRADHAACPVLLLQGLDDPIVLPAQSEKFATALADRKLPYAYLTFEGESHGFRRADTVVTCLESELSFYGQIFGFDPPGVPKIELTVGERPAPAPTPPPLPPA